MTSIFLILEYCLNLFNKLLLLLLCVCRERGLCVWYTCTCMYRYMHPCVCTYRSKKKALSILSLLSLSALKQGLSLNHSHFFLAGLADKKVPLTPSSVSTVLGLQVQARLHGGLSPIWVLMVAQQALLTSELFLQPSKNISIFI